PTASTPPAGTTTGSHCRTGSPSTVTGAGAPVTHTVASCENRRAGPVRVHSSPAAPSGLLSARLPVRNDRSSIRPEGGMPTPQYPVRPGQSCTVVSTPGSSTSTQGSGSCTVASVVVVADPSTTAGSASAARSSETFVGTPSTRTSASAARSAAT